MQPSPDIDTTKTLKHLDNRILDCLIEGFQIIDYDWRYIFVNEAVAKHGKSSKEELLGYKMMEKYPGIEQTEMFKTLEHCMQTRTSDTIINEFTHNNGKKEWFELRIEPIPQGLFILSLNITKLKKKQEKIKKLNRELEEKVRQRTAELSTKNKELTDSIEYSKHIQNAKLPPRQVMYTEFPESFILYEPKDIVSGDFYFFHKKNELTYIACADCTGHGVPGALLSMLCSEKLNEVVLKNSCTGEILKELNNGIKSSLKQSKQHNDAGHHSTKDGMDIALCSINSENNTIYFSGANRPLWLIRKGAKEIEEIKPTKHAIGGYTKENQFFSKHQLQLNSGDTIYIFSDGYPDLMGGEKGKKLKIGNFKKILIDIQKKSMQEQKEFLRNFARTWRNEEEQVDDILVMGIRM